MPGLRWCGASFPWLLAVVLVTLALLDHVVCEHALHNSPAEDGVSAGTDQLDGRLDHWRGRHHWLHHHEVLSDKEWEEPTTQSSEYSIEDIDGHDVLDCEPKPGDKLLARAVVKADFRPLGFTERKWFFPHSGRDQRTINCVRVLDMRRDGTGGYAYIMRGGVGHHYVEIGFKSEFSRGFRFVVEVYGQ